MASTRAFSSARAAPAGRAARAAAATSAGIASRSEPRPSARRPPGTRRGARRSPMQPARARRAGVQRREHVAAELERHRVTPSVRMSMRTRRPSAEQRGDLVEQPGGRAHPVVLDPRAEPGQLEAVGLPRAGYGAQREAERDRERGGGGQAGAARQVGRDLEASRAELHAGVRSSAAAPRTKARQPGRGAARRPISKRSSSPRSKARAPARPSSARRRHGHAEVDGERQAEAVVVVGVLADQVHPPGGECHHAVDRGRGHGAGSAGQVTGFAIALLYALISRLLLPAAWWGRWRVEGLELVPKHGPLLVVPNHDSQMDPVLVAVALRKIRPLRFLARADLWKFLEWRRS